MASFNVTAEDSTPLIAYAPSGAWVDSPANDSSLASYSGSSLHTTSAQGATATINFNGTGIWLYGGKRPNYGAYTIAVDGKTTTNGNANSANPAFQQLLGSASGLSNGPHTVILTNTGSGSAVDIDSLVFQSQVGSAGEPIAINAVDDSNPAVTYSPTGAWETTSSSQYLNNTIHYSSAAGSQASLSFSGEAVAVYGTVSPDHANIQISVDGNTQVMNGGAGGAASVLHPKTLLYFADNLGSQQHSLVVTGVQQQGTGNFVDLDAVHVYMAQTASASVNGMTSSTTSSASLSSSAANGSAKSTSATSTSKGSIIGAAVGATVAVLVILSLLVFVLLRRRSRGSRDVEARRLPLTPALPIQGPDAGYAEGKGQESFNEKAATLRPSYDSRSSSQQSESSVSSTAPMPRRPLPQPPPPSITRSAYGHGSEAELAPSVASTRPSRPQRPPGLQLFPS